jgi:hypothetical protein
VANLETHLDVLLDYLHRFWGDLIGRTDGPMTFRFFLQPIMALIAALGDGIKDAKLGRDPYFWKLTHGASAGDRVQTFREGFSAVTRILLLGVGMDVIYQFKVFGGFRYPIETLVIAIVLAFLPYLLLRGPIARIARQWQRRHPPQPPRIP